MTKTDDREAGRRELFDLFSAALELGHFWPVLVVGVDLDEPESNALLVHRAITPAQVIWMLETLADRVRADPGEILTYFDDP